MTGSFLFLAAALALALAASLRRLRALQRHSQSQWSRVVQCGARAPRALLVIAHPDDEAMFFVPTLQSLRAHLHADVRVLCLSNGTVSVLGGGALGRPHGPVSCRWRRCA